MYHPSHLTVGKTDTQGRRATQWLSPEQNPGLSPYQWLGLVGFKASPPAEGKPGLREAHSPVTVDSRMMRHAALSPLALDLSPPKLVATVLQGVRGLRSSSYAAGSEAVTSQSFRKYENKPSYSRAMFNGETLVLSPEIRNKTRISALHHFCST